MENSSHGQSVRVLNSVRILNCDEFNLTNNATTILENLAHAHTHAIDPSQETINGDLFAGRGAINRAFSESLRGGPFQTVKHGNIGLYWLS